MVGKISFIGVPQNDWNLFGGPVKKRQNEGIILVTNSGFGLLGS